MINSNLYKIEYQDEKKSPIQLKEYVISNEGKDRYIIFKFYNAIKESVKAIEVEVTELDSEDNEIQTSVFSYKDFNGKPHKEFVPYQKYKVKNICETIRVKLVKALFETKYVDKGEWVQFKKPKPIKEKKTYKVKQFAAKRKFKILWVLPILLLLATSGLIYFSISHFKKISLNFKDKNFEYTISDDEVSIDKYIGSRKSIAELIVPAEVNGYSVTAIGRNAFQNVSAKKVTFQSEEISIGAAAFEGNELLEIIEGNDVNVIGRNAFKDCVGLTTVNLKGVEEIRSSAFENCESLVSLSFPSETGTVVLNNAFVGCIKLQELRIPNGEMKEGSLSGLDNLTTLVYGFSSNHKFDNMFNETYPESLKRVDIENDNIDYNYFFGSDILLDSLTIGPNTKVVFGALGALNLENYACTDIFEILGNNIVSVKSDTRDLDISLSNVILNKNALSDVRIQSLTLSGENITLAEGSLENQIELRSMVLNGEGDSISKALGKNDIEIQRIDIVQGKDLPSNYLNGVSAQVVTFDSDVSINEKALDNMNISSELNVYNNYSLSKYGTLNILNNAKIHVLDNGTGILAEGFFSNLSIKDEQYQLADTFKKCPNKLFENCKEITKLDLSSFESFAECAIGEGMEKLSDVIVPKFNGAYSNFNLSYAYTKNLIITEQMTFVDAMLEDCTKLKSIELHKIGNSFNSLCLPDTIKTFIINTTDAIPSNYFSGYDNNFNQIENIAVISETSINSTAFSGCSTLINLYLEKVDYTLLSELNALDRKLTVISKETINNYYNNLVCYQEGYNSDKEYIVQLPNGKSISVKGFFLVDAEEEVKEQIGITMKTIRVVSPYNELIEGSYFNPNASVTAKYYNTIKTTLKQTTPISLTLDYGFDYKGTGKTIEVIPFDLDYTIWISESIKRDGYYFMGWQLPNGEFVTMASLIEENTTLTAYWLSEEEYLSSYQTIGKTESTYKVILPKDKEVEITIFGKNSIFNTIIVQVNNERINPTGDKFRFTAKAGVLYEVKIQSQEQGSFTTNLEEDPSVTSFIAITPKYEENEIGNVTIIAGENEIIGTITPYTFLNWQFKGWYTSEGVQVIDRFGNITIDLGNYEELELHTEYEYSPSN